MQASIACVTGLVTCHLNQSNMAGKIEVVVVVGGLHQAPLRQLAKALVSPPWGAQGRLLNFTPARGGGG